MMSSDTLLLTDHFFSSPKLRYHTPDLSEKIRLISSCRSGLRDRTHNTENKHREEENPEESQTQTASVSIVQKPIKEKTIVLISESLSPKSAIQGTERSSGSKILLSHNDGRTIRHKNPSRESFNIRRLKKCTIEQLLSISRSKISFGSLLPGQIIGKSLDISNKTNQNLVVQIYLNCENPQFQETEEYVYSIRRSHLYDFNDKHFLIMTPYSSASFKVTLKVPCSKNSCDNKGNMDICIQGLESSLRIPLESNIQVPKIFCPKALYNKQAGCDIINLIAKEGRKSEFKLPLRNTSNTPVTLEFSFYSSANETEDPSMYCSMYPEIMDIGEGATSLMTFTARSRQVTSRNKDKSVPKKVRSFKKIILGKIPETSIVYTFFVNLEIS